MEELIRSLQEAVTALKAAECSMRRVKESGRWPDCADAFYGETYLLRSLVNVDSALHYMKTAYDVSVQASALSKKFA